VTRLPSTNEALVRLSHVIAHRDSYLSDGVLEQSLVNIASNSGSPSGSLRIVRSFSEASAIADWFENGNVDSLKNWFYVRAKLDYVLAHPPYAGKSNDHAFEGLALHGMFSLVSDNSSLINWYATIDDSFNEKRVDNVKQFDFWTKQFFLAIRGEWDILGDRCERIIASPPQGSREKKFLIDHHFYLALARGDLAEMTSIVEQLVSPKSISRRGALEGGYTKDLLCTPSIIYCKLAWRHGYQIKVDSPYVPHEWLPVRPLENYIDKFEFMLDHRIR